MEPRSPFAGLFGSSLSEFRAALANFDLVDEVVRADGCEPGDRERMAFAYAEWALYRAAGRLRRVYRAKMGEAKAEGAA